jgi:F-type H+-transporting ATPase subunit delta
MNESQISVRYAKAFFLLAKSKNTIDTAYKDIELVLTVLKDSKDLEHTFDSPIIQTSKKVAVLTEIFKSHISELTFNFLKTVFENKREAFLKMILLDVQQYCKTEQGIRSAILTTAVPISEIIKEELKQKINDSYKCTTELSEKVDEDIIGGFVLQIDDVQYNASLKLQLNNIKHSLINGQN